MKRLNSDATHHRCSFDAPTGIRIQTETGLSRYPLPIGIWAQNEIPNAHKSPWWIHRSSPNLRPPVFISLMFSATSCHIQGDDFHVPPRLTPNKSALNSVGKESNLALKPSPKCAHTLEFILYNGSSFTLSATTVFNLSI